MFKQTIARVFCFITVFLLSGNVALSAVPVSKVHEKASSDKQQTIAPYLQVEKDSTFVSEKDPFEDLDFFAQLPVYEQFVFVAFIQSAEQKHFFKSNGPHISSEPIWLLVRHILV